MNLHAAVYVARELSDRLYAAGFRGVVDMDRIGAVIDAYSNHQAARFGLIDYLLGCGVHGEHAPCIAALAVRAYLRGGRDWGGAGAFASVLVALYDASGRLRDDQARVRSLMNVMEQYEHELIDADTVRTRLTRGSYWRGRMAVSREVMQYWCA